MTFEGLIVALITFCVGIAFGWAFSRINSMEG